MRWTLESPVHNERCTPGLGTREMETAEGNPGTASSPYFHLRKTGARTKEATNGR